MNPAISLDTPVGLLTLVEAKAAIVAVRWVGSGGKEVAADQPTPLLLEARRQLEAYFAGTLTRFDLPLLPAGSAFDRRVWSAMRRIPHGQTSSYGELAMEIGSAPRAIGGACGRNPIPIVIPCHRVLGRNGLGGYSGGAGLATKRFLLALEEGSADADRPTTTAQPNLPPTPQAALVTPQQ